MGRKKIKIRPIKDDRNRAVTFLKRKNGLFKKAFELAVLCRAEVAVIVFAGNKKLYEFASTDMKDVLYRYTQAPEPYEHRGPEDFTHRDDGDSDDSDDMGMDVSSEYHRVMSHTPQPHGASQFGSHMGHQRRQSDDSIISDRRQSLHHGTPQILPHRTPPLHSRHPSLQHIGTPPQHFQVPMAPNHGSPQPATSALRGGMMQQQPMQHGIGPDGMGLGIGMNPQPYGVNYNPYGHQQVYIAQDNPPRRPSSTPNYQYSHEPQNPYLPSPPLPHPQQQQPQQQPPPQPEPPVQQPQVTEIKSKGRMKSIHTPVSSRASSLAAHFDTSRSQYERTQTHPPRSHSVDSAQPQQIIPGNMPLSHSPPPITTTTPGSTSNHSAGTGQRPKLSLHIPDDEDPSQQAEESGASATPGTASPEVHRQDHQDNIKSENSNTSAGERRHSAGETSFLPPPTSASSLLPTSRLPGPGLGAFDSNNSGGTPLSALPSRYAGDMLPSPSSFYPEFYGSLPSAGTSNLRSGFSGMMNGTPVIARADEAGVGFGGGFGGNGGGKRQGEELQGTNKRARN